jgi:hypothetical protein
MISYLNNGISFTDTDELSPFDRELILKCLRDIKKKEQEEASKASGRRTSRYS